MADLPDLPQMIRELVLGDFFEGLPPEEINCGFCVDFAEQLNAKLVDRGVLDGVLLDSGDLGAGLRYGRGEHVWLWLRGRHYDAEAPEGVEDWRDLPFFKRNYTKRVRRKDSAKVEAERILASSRLWEKFHKEFTLKQEPGSSVK